MEWKPTTSNPLWKTKKSRRAGKMSGPIKSGTLGPAAGGTTSPGRGGRRHGSWEGPDTSEWGKHQLPEILPNFIHISSWTQAWT